MVRKSGGMVFVVQINGGVFIYIFFPHSHANKSLGAHKSAHTSAYIQEQI